MRCPPRMPQDCGSSRDGRSTPRLRSTDLFRAGTVELEIEHAGDVYRLRITSNGKLILNK